ncbi:hypothetical protein RRG08_024640 [Elysia crispata]|uniref:Uncharacterized protein n=1 Tax=Elysia crispata TaxID=231223 RepID=A0AAE1DN39_9GAST|nr:hypothetical protein RRG08_024640 [Elysia crispata]
MEAGFEPGTCAVSAQQFTNSVIFHKSGETCYGTRHESGRYLTRAQHIPIDLVVNLRHIQEMSDFYCFDVMPQIRYSHIRKPSLEFVRGIPALSDKPSID